jgi:hypothetical protein
MSNDIGLSQFARCTDIHFDLAMDFIGNQVWPLPSKFNLFSTNHSHFFSLQYYDSVHLASDQKDLLISQLKAEIFEIQQRDKDYLALRDQLYTIQ